MSSVDTALDDFVDDLNLRNLKVSQEAKPQDDEGEEKKEEDYVDIDQENLQDTFQVSLYAPHIFEYYKEREVRRFYLIIMLFSKLVD